MIAACEDERAVEEPFPMKRELKGDVAIDALDRYTVEEPFPMKRELKVP